MEETKLQKNNNIDKRKMTSKTHTQNKKKQNTEGRRSKRKATINNDSDDAADVDFVASDCVGATCMCLSVCGSPSLSVSPHNTHTHT